MSQSGIPIVSDLAKAGANIASSIGDIASGKNAFEALGRIIATPIAFGGSVAHSSTFGLSDKLPGVGDFTHDSANFQDNPYSRDNALNLVRSTGKAGLVVGGAAVAAPFVAAETGLGAAASTLASGGVLNQITTGNFSGALNSVGGLAGDALKGTELGSAYSDISGALSPYTTQIQGLINQGSKPALPAVLAPVNNVNPAAQTVNSTTGISGTTLILISVAGLASLFLAKKKGLI